MPQLGTRCGVQLHDPAEVPPLLAGSGSAGALWHGLVPKSAEARANNGVHSWRARSAYARSYCRINQIEPLLHQAHNDPLTDVPPVVQCDGIWLRVQTQTETVKLDKRHGTPHERGGKKVVRLFALGFWSDGSGKREVLDS